MIDQTVARSHDEPVSFRYSIEPMVDSGDLLFYQQFLHVQIGQQMRKGYVIARTYLPAWQVGSENLLIHFNLVREMEVAILSSATLDAHVRHAFFPRRAKV